jgi:hypothetical protein
LRTVEYVVPLGENARKRHYHRSRAGKIIAFVVQLEVFDNAEWKVVTRYDSAHGFAHMDHYSRNGKKTKRSVSLELTEALTLADEDIKENWKTYRKAFLGEAG